MWKQAKEVLEAVGYTFKPGDDALLHLCVEYAQASLLCDCNVESVPPQMYHVWALRTAGAFFAAKQVFWPNDVDHFPAAAAVKHLKLGDTDVTFDAEGERQTAEQHMAALTAGLLHYGRNQVACCRRLPL